MNLIKYYYIVFFVRLSIFLLDISMHCRMKAEQMIESYKNVQ